MKKTLILLVVMLLVAGVAFGATIKGSKHDLSAGGLQTVRGTLTEICVYCHTPHAASAVTFAPLWNRSTAQSWGGNDKAYTSSTMNGTSLKPSQLTGISSACLSCHDGDIGGETLVNGPGSGNTAMSIGALTFTGVANLNDGTAGLSNDHPVGMSMADINTDDKGIRTAPLNGLVRLFTVGGKQVVECASCHLVHDNAISPFLAMTNANSEMCLTCKSDRSHVVL